MGPKDADRMANCVDPDQTAPQFDLRLFTQTCLPENLGSLWYTVLSVALLHVCELHHDKTDLCHMQKTSI